VFFTAIHFKQKFYILHSKTIRCKKTSKYSSLLNIMSLSWHPIIFLQKGASLSMAGDCYLHVLAPKDDDGCSTVSLEVLKF